MAEKRVRVRSFRELSAKLDEHPDIDRLRAEADAALTAELVAYSHRSWAGMGVVRQG